MIRSVAARRPVLGGGAGLALVVAALLAAPVAPVFAATPTVSTLGELQSALADCTTAPNTVSLGADISAPGTALATSCDTVIDLGSRDLSVRNVVIAAGTTLTVTGPTDGTGGTLTADARNAGNRAPGVQTSGATLRVDGGTVTARGDSSTAAGIGGGTFESAGTLIVSGGTVNAYADGYGAAVGGGYVAGAGGIVRVSSGALNAYAQGPYNVAVGGAGGGASGPGGAGAQITVTGGTLTASTSSGYGTAIGGGVSGLRTGDLGGSGGSLTIAAGGEVVAIAPRNAIGAGWNSDLTAPVGDFGSVRVDGILRLPSGGFFVGTHAAAGAEVTVGATGRILGSEADSAAGASISGPGSIDNGGAITLSPANTVTGNNRLVSFSTNDPSVRVFAPSFRDGARTLPSPPAGTAWNTASDGRGEWFTDTSSTAGSGTLSLSAVVPATLAVSTDSSALTATAGERYTFPVTVNGPTGIALVPQPEVSYTSADCAIGDGGVFTVARSCGVTASTIVQGVPVQKTFTVRVVPGAPTALTLTPVAVDVTEGGSVAFVVSGTDAAGNAADVDAAVLRSSSPKDTVVGRSVTFSGAGAHSVTATLGSTTATAAVSVVAGPLASLSLTPSTTRVAQGGTVEFTVTGTDAAGNPVDTSDAVLRSSVASDVVRGSGVTFPHASPHTITATLGSVSASVTIEVVAAAAPSPGPTSGATPAGLARTGVDGGAVRLVLAAGLTLLLAGGVLLVRRRTRRHTR